MNRLKVIICILLMSAGLVGCNSSKEKEKPTTNNNNNNNKVEVETNPASIHVDAK